MTKYLFLTLSICLLTRQGFSQTDSVKKMNTIGVSGSVDLYYRNAFNNAKDATNNFTSFTNSNQQIQLGMASAKIDYTRDRFFATVDLGYGKRAGEFSYNDKGILANIKQAYIAYNVTERLKLSIGKWGTHIGYELLDAPLNRNYSMSYGFSYGPFFHTGMKADIAINSRSGLMLGIANPTDNINGNSPYSVLIGQFNQKLFNDHTVVYINYQGGKNGTESNFAQWDLVLTNTVSEKLALNYDGTVFMTKVAGKKSIWKSNAFYVNFDPSNKIGLTYRSEFFYDKNALSAGAFATNIFANTLSLNYKINKLTLTPEFRIETAKDPIYSNKQGIGMNKSASIVVAAIYRF